MSRFWGCLRPRREVCQYLSVFLRQIEQIEIRLATAKSDHCGSREQAGVAGRRHKVCLLSLPMEEMLGTAAPHVRICDVFAWQDSTPGFGESRRWRPGDRNGEEPTGMDGNGEEKLVEEK